MNAISPIFCAQTQRLPSPTRDGQLSRYFQQTQANSLDWLASEYLITLLQLFFRSEYVGKLIMSEIKKAPIAFQRMMRLPCDPVGKRPTTMCNGTSLNNYESTCFPPDTSSYFTTIVVVVARSKHCRSAIINFSASECRK